MPKIGSTKYEMAYVGIDPGKSGGIAELRNDEWRLWVMPPTEADIWAVLSDLGRVPHGKSYSHVGQIAVIEAVHAMPKQGVTSSFNFGMGYGGLRMALTAAEVPFEAIAPQTWMKALSIPPGKKDEGRPEKKNKLRARAQQLYPRLSIWKDWNKGQQMAVCDAILIAHYCKMRNNG